MTERLTMRGFQTYVPEYNVFGDHVPHFCDDQGRDWYMWRHKFGSATETLKIIYDEANKGMVMGYALSAELMAPFDYTLTEIPIAEVPDGFDLDVEHSWFFQDGKLVQTETGRARELRDLRDIILTATDFMAAADYPGTEDERAEVLSTRKALRDISALDDFPNVVIPALPDAMLSAAKSKGMVLGVYNRLRKPV